MSRIKLKKINDTEVREIPNFTGGEKDNRPVKGEKIFANPYCNAFLCAKKASGKSTVIFKIIKECITRETKVYLFCSTIYNDNNWRQIRKYLELRKIEFECFTSIVENRVDHVDRIIEELELDAKDREAEEKNEKPKPTVPKLLNLNEDVEEEKQKKYKSKYKSPKVLFVFDDLSKQLQSESISTLVKKNRHFYSCCIFSSQWVTDLRPEARLQIEYFLLFKAINPDKLLSIYKEADIGTSYPVFKKIYDFAT